MNYYRKLYEAGRALRQTFVVDDNFPEMMRKFDSALRTIECAHDMPKIICLCGSTKFKDEFIAANKRLTKQGYIVLSVGWFGHSEDSEPTDEEKVKLDTLHKRKIDLADLVFVLNVGGYLGKSTISEIEYAYIMGKPVEFLEQKAFEGVV